MSLQRGAIGGLLLVMGLWPLAAPAEEYMKRGASVADYEQALDDRRDRCAPARHRPSVP